jgi:hypothetical protein
MKPLFSKCWFTCSCTNERGIKMISQGVYMAGYGLLALSHKAVWWPCLLAVRPLNKTIKPLCNYSWSAIKCMYVCISRGVWVCSAIIKVWLDRGRAFNAPNIRQVRKRATFIVQIKPNVTRARSADITRLLLWARAKTSFMAAEGHNSASASEQERPAANYTKRRGIMRTNERTKADARTLSLASFDERDMIEIAAAFVKTVFCLQIYMRACDSGWAAPTRPSLDANKGSCLFYCSTLTRKSILFDEALC